MKEIDLEKPTSVFAAGSSVSMFVNGNTVMLDNNLIVFPYDKDGKYVVELTIKPVK